jgi:hypothetical protein
MSLHPRYPSVDHRPATRLYEKGTGQMIARSMEGIVRSQILKGAEGCYEELSDCCRL